MRRNKIKQKYLNLISSNNDNKISIIVSDTEKKIIKGLISFLLIFLMLFWSVIPSVVLKIIGINPNNLSSIVKYVITFANDILFLVLLIGIYYKDLKDNLKKYFKCNLKNNIKTSIAYWLIGLGIMMASNYLIAIVTNGQLADNEEAVRSMVDIAPLYMAFQLIVYAPLSEELIFRRSFRDIFKNKWTFAIISGVVFGGLHAITSITDMVSLLYLIPYCSLGIVFGLLYYKTNNIFSTIVIHAIHNSMALVLYLLTL